jgi:hypothetical protein
VTETGLAGVDFDDPDRTPEGETGEVFCFHLFPWCRPTFDSALEARPLGAATVGVPAEVERVVASEGE